MTDAEQAALQKIHQALDATSPGLSEGVTIDSHLVDDEILDSLDLMNFMFELEGLHGAKIEQVTETFEDYSVRTLVGFLTAA